jgi:hypothetical protein
MRDMTSQYQLDDLASALVDSAHALQLLSAAWYRLAADAAPREGLSREQEVRLTGALHDVAAAFARCSRACRQGGSTLMPLVSSRSAPAEGVV